MTHPVISATPASTNNLHQRHPAFITAATALLTRFCCVDTAETIRSLCSPLTSCDDIRGYRMNGGLVSLAAFPGAWMNLIGVDVGGTFTDLVLADTDTGRATVHKVPTTPDDPSIGVTEGVIALCAMADLNPSRIDQVLHGTTIATNAVLEHRGAVTGLITTPWLPRHSAYRPSSAAAALLADAANSLAKPAVRATAPPPCGVRAADRRRAATCWCRWTRMRCGPRRGHCARTASSPSRSAFCSPTSTRRTRRAAKQLVLEEYPEAFVTTSAEVAPQFREFERFTTAAMNAFVGPKVRDYISVLSRRLRAAGCGGELQVMGSNGGAATVRMVAERPVLTMLSGPAAGVLGGTWAGALSGRDNLITFDMGGTSADIGIVTGGRFAEATARDTWIGGFPILVPMIDIHTIGAGGGSIARRDSGGAFRVGPQSRRRRAGTGGLWPRRLAADGDRRECRARPPRSRPFPGRRHEARCRRLAAGDAAVRARNWTFR